MATHFEMNAEPWTLRNYDEADLPGLYARDAPRYLDARWQSVLPLPHGQKSYPPRGFTGGDGRWPTPADFDEWRRSHKWGNLALRPPRSVVGLDRDAYGDRQGDATWMKLVAAAGNLESTWISTSRPGTTSGISWYQIPEALVITRGDLADHGDGVEIIRFGHRYGVVPGSIHPEGRPYVWVGPDGRARDDVPSPGDLPFLPSAWCNLLESRPERPRQVRPRKVRGERGEVLLFAPGSSMPSGQWPKEIRQVVEVATANLVEGRRHTTAVSAVASLSNHQCLGVPFATEALEYLRVKFVEAMAYDLGTQAALHDFEEIVHWADFETDRRPPEARPWAQRSTSRFTPVRARRRGHR